MKWLLDVDFLCALAWKTHASHAEACRWVTKGHEIVSSPIVELGFIRVSLRAYSATFADAQIALDDVVKSVEFLPDDVCARELPLCSAEHSTDAHLVALARRHGLKLVTLDKILIKQAWAKNIAENPI